MVNLKRMSLMVCVAAISMSIAACGDFNKTGTQVELELRGFTDPSPVFMSSNVFDVGVGSCRVVVFRDLKTSLWVLESTKDSGKPMTDVDLTRIKANAEELGLTPCFDAQQPPK